VKLTEEEIEEKWRILTLYESQFIVQRNYFSKEFIFGWLIMLLLPVAGIVLARVKAKRT